MKLVRNTNADGHGKYMLVLTRKLEAYDPSGGRPFESNPVWDAVALLIDEGVIDQGVAETEGEFFVLRLKDRHAGAALRAYANSVEYTDPEFAAEVRELASRAGELSPWCKEPD